VAFAIRVLVMLAAVVPLFAATAFSPVWWHMLIAAAIGAALGQLAVRLTRGRRVAGWSVAVVAVAVAGVGVARPYVHAARHADPPPTRLDYFIIRSDVDRPGAVTLDDAGAIQAEVPSIALVVPVSATSAPLTTDAQNWATTVVGTTLDYFELRHLRVATGSRFAADSAEHVLVLGETTAARLFDTAEISVGQTIRVQGKPFTILGVLAHQGTSPEGQDLDDTAIVPLAASLAKLEGGLFHGALFVSAKSPADSARVETELRRVLRVRHRLGPSEPDDFMLRRPDFR
jgi:hypothetical protein